MRTASELRENASLWWPESLKAKSAKASVLPLLLETQDDFLRLLLLAKGTPFRLFDLISAAEFPANLFLKHLVILADYGGEPIQRLGRSFVDIFPQAEKRYYFEFAWGGKQHRYVFEALPIKGLNNKKLSIDGERLLKPRPLDALLKDMIAILLFASTSDLSTHAGLDVCEIGSLLGDDAMLMRYVKQKYLVVSRITGGATANNLGQLAQSQVYDTLKSSLGPQYVVRRNGLIPLTGYEKQGGMPFDIVVEKGNKQVGIEISFQVTTNSTIERKAGQAADRQRLMHANGHLIGYVIDGAGNFQRTSALSTICEHSDCTVAYTADEFQILVQWIQEAL